MKADGSPIPQKKSSKKRVSPQQLKCEPMNISKDAEKDDSRLEDNNLEAWLIKSENMPKKETSTLTLNTTKKPRNYTKGMKEFPCRFCDKVFYHRGTRYSHHRSRHPAIPGQHVCNICGSAAKFNSNALLLMHKRKRHGIRADGTSVNLKRQKRTSKETTEKILGKFKCQHCDKVFDHRTTRNAHQLAKHPVIPGQHIYDICGKAFNSNGYLLVHRRRLHNMKVDGGPTSPLKKWKRKSYAEEKEKFEPKNCDVCGVRITSFGGYINHKRFSHEKRYKEHCNSCGMRFISSTAFKMHLLAKHREDPVTKKLVDEGARIWKCSVYGCPSKFMLKVSLENHTKKFHSSDEGNVYGEGGDEDVTSMRYHCSFCGKGFWGGAKLRKHELIHELEGTRNFKCELCGSGFLTGDYLKKHQRQVHKIFLKKRSN